MAYARWQVEAHQQVEGGGIALDHWIAAAKRNETARAKLEGPAFPQRIGYLWDWTMQLHGRSGAHMSGLNPLSYTTIRDWAELTNQWPEPHEVNALIELDALLLGIAREPEPEPEPAKPQSAWPEKKNG